MTRMNEVVAKGQVPEDLIARFVLGRKGDGRAIYDASAKQALIEHCLQPGVSVAAAALQAGVNANLLRKWMLRHLRAHGQRPPALPRMVSDTAELIPVVLKQQLPAAAHGNLPAVASTPLGGGIAIHIGGARIELDRNFDADVLTRALQVLRA